MNRVIHQLVGIRHFEPIRFTDLIGYMSQKKELQSNTMAFLAGRPANNVLLVGARGTGKSSSVSCFRLPNVIPAGASAREGRFPSFNSLPKCFKI